MLGLRELGARKGFHTYEHQSAHTTHLLSPTLTCPPITQMLPPNLPLTSCGPLEALNCDEALVWSPTDIGEGKATAVSGVSPPAQSKHTT